MRVGLTYDLRADYLAEGYGEEETAEFDSPDTIAAIEEALRARGHQVVRIGHLRALTARLVAGERWDWVFNIAEGLHGIGREAQVPALLDGYGIPYTFSDPLVMALTLDKAMAKRVVRDNGLATAPFAVIAAGEEVAGLTLPYPLFAKPLAEGTGKGISDASRIGEPARAARVIGELLARFRQPVLVETFLPGREFTTGIVGNGRAARIVATVEVKLKNAEQALAYGYDNKEHYDRFVDYVLVEDAEARAAGDLALACYRALNCRDAGRVDLRSDASGRPHFLEVNPLAGLNPVKSDLPILARLAGWSYRRLIDEIVDACLARTGLATERRKAS
ncbi:MAG: D-alanine--D-alanine ligase [Alphaproteobacteria bacterium]|nr:D-alanine--D-alanine ligase [Alphaproteobacteria bacterium]